MEKVNQFLLQAITLEKSYDKRLILKGVNLDIGYGETVAIMGKSGCGKSTLLSLLGGLSLPEKGELVCEGKKLNPRKMRVYRRDYVGFLFQNSGLVDEFTVQQNIEAALIISKRKGDPMEYLTMVGLDSRRHAMPRQLSGGERHRVALARALAKAPRILLLDEPTEGLDRETGQQIIDLTLNVCKEKKIAMVMITHCIEHARQMDKCYVLEDGQLIRREI